MSSKYATDLYLLATELEQDGRPVSAEIAREGGKRMDRLENLVISIMIKRNEEKNETSDPTK